MAAQQLHSAGLDKQGKWVGVHWAGQQEQLEYWMGPEKTVRDRSTKLYRRVFWAD